MLYHRWLDTTQKFARQPAVFEGNKVTTFAELAEAVRQIPQATAPVVARTGGIDFIVRVIGAWRDGQPVIPLEREAEEPRIFSNAMDGICLIKYTPGACGVPRGIFLTGKQVVADGDRLVAAMELSPAVPNLSVLSLGHSYGFSNVVLPLILHGVPFHLAAVPFPRVIEEIFRCHKAMTVPAVPSMWRAWQRAGILKRAPISLALSAGAPLSIELETDIHLKAGLKLHNFYGASECGGISLDTSDIPRESADQVGTLLPGISISRNAEGRLLVESDAVASGYDMPRDGDLLGDGLYLTRDLGFVDPTGGIRLTGTTGGAINVAGRKVSPEKIETALQATGMVRSVHVYPVLSQDPERYEEVAAKIVLRAGASLEQLKLAASSSLQSWEFPRHWKETYGL